MNIYLTYGAIALIGTAISVVMIAANQSSKAKQNNVIFPWKTFWGIDLIIKITGSLLTALLFLTWLPPVFKIYSGYKYLDIIVRIFMGLAGYFGSDLANRVFSAANSRVNAAIQYKSSQADIMNGTTDAPTPAVKPGKQDPLSFEKPAAPNDQSV